MCINNFTNILYELLNVKEMKLLIFHNESIWKISKIEQIINNETKQILNLYSIHNLIFLFVTSYYMFLTYNFNHCYNILY